MEVCQNVESAAPTLGLPGAGSGAIVCRKGTIEWGQMIELDKDLRILPKKESVGRAAQ